MLPSAPHARPGAIRAPRLFRALRLAAIVLCALPPAAVLAAEGHLRITSDAAGLLRLEDDLGGVTRVRLASGETMFWSIPGGTYTATFLPGDSTERTVGDAPRRGPAAESPTGARLSGRVMIHPNTMTLLAIRTAAGSRQLSAEPEGGLGQALHLAGETLRALPGDAGEVLAALDTHLRWRPGLRLGDCELADPTERREALALTGVPLAGARVALSPGATPGTGALWQLTPGVPGAGWLSLGGDLSLQEQQRLQAQVRLAERTLLGLPLRGTGWVRYGRLEDAAPRAGAERILPHNDARTIDLLARLEAGRASAGILAWADDGAAFVQAPGARPATARGWGAAIEIAAHGLSRDYYVEAYRHNLEHAPHEDASALATRTSFAARLAPHWSGQLALRTDYRERSLADGMYGKDLGAYARPGGNPGADASGIYWDPGDEDEFLPAHAFDYYRWYSTLRLGGDLTLRHAASRSLLLTLAGSAARFTSRRFEHYAPTEIASQELAEIRSHALVVGYDPIAGAPDDRPLAPGRAFVGRAGFSAQQRWGDRLRFEGALGALAFSSRDSGLVSLTDPLSGGSSLAAEHLEAALWHTQLEAHGGLRWGRTKGPQVWGLAYRRAHLPPLCALTTPRAYLAMTDPEGVMGNPALAPETETGAEAGLSWPVTLILPGRLTLAAYGTRLADALALGRSRIAPSGTAAREVPVYTNEGTLRRWGLHAEAAWGDPAEATWLRVAYDLARIESARNEPVMLDEPWLDPTRPTGEYESEGYAGAWGGILDEILVGEDWASGERPSFQDRRHCVSVALVHHRPGPIAQSRTWGQLLGGWTLGAIARYETGRPFSQTLLAPALLLPGTADVPRGPDDPSWETLVTGRERLALRLPARWSLDLALQRRFRSGTRHVILALEGRNLLDRENVVTVYRSTGDADSDGCLEDAGCAADPALPADLDPSLYAEALEDPLHYAAPRVLRASVTIEF